MECALTETNKRKPLLLLDGYEHRFDRMSKDGTKTFFRCIRRGCKGRAHAPTDGREAIMVVQHGHNPDRQRAQTRKHRMAVRQATESSIDTVRTAVITRRKRAHINAMANRPSTAADMKQTEHFRAAPNTKKVNAARMNNVYSTDEFGLTAEDSDFGDDDKDKRWSRAARVLLIREIQARPALWAEQSDDHRNPLRRELKREVARVVSTKLGFTVTYFDVTKQWGQLKSQYEHFLKLRERLERDGFCETRPKFSFAKHMKFLLDDDDFYARCFVSEKRDISTVQPDRMPLTLSIASASTQVEERKGIPLILPSTSVDHDSKSMMSLLQRQQETASQKGSSSEEIDCADPNSIEQNGEPYDDRIQCSPDDELDGFGWDGVEKESNTKWSRESRIMLIREVRARPALWVSKLDRHRVAISTLNVLRHQIAQAISATFNIPLTGEAVARQWKYLKVEHRRYLRNLELFKKDGGLNGIKRPFFQYAEYMKFLLENGVHSRCVGLEESMQQNLQCEVESSFLPVDSASTEDASRKRESHVHSPMDVLNPTLSVSDFQEVKAASVVGSAQWLHCGETDGGDQIEEAITETCGVRPRCSLINEQDLFEEQTIPSDQLRSLREIRTNFWCDDENRKGPDGDDSIMHWSTSADGSALPFSQPHLETAAAKDNDVVCLSDEEESVSSSSDVWAECTTVDKYDRFGRRVASAMRKAVAQDPLIAQQFRVDLGKILFALEESIMNAMLQKR